MSALRIAIVIVAIILLGVAIFSLVISSKNMSGEVPGGQRPDGEARVVVGDKKAEKATDSLKISISLQSKQITLEKPLDINLIVENTGSEPRELTFNSGQKYDFIIKDENSREVWRWSDGLMFTQVITGETVGPGESITYTAQWPLTDLEGSKVGAGDYEVVAKVMANETKDVEVAVGFSVKQ